MIWTRLNAGCRQKGVVAVEFALTLPILILLIGGLLFISIYLYHYTAVVKAATDAARYMSTVSPQEMREPALARSAAAVAEQIAVAETSDLIKTEGAPTIEVFCGQARSCNGVRNGALPQVVIVRVEVYLKDTFFGFFDTGRYGWAVKHTAYIPYVST